MATLRSIFKLYDGYTSTISKIDRQTNAATSKILKASGATDTFNDKLKATGASADTASSSLKKFISIAAIIAGVVKGMNIADEFTNTASRLNLINDGLQTQAELQDKIFAAADRAKGNYSVMANAIARIGLLAGDAFNSNDELIAFTELLQKSFKVSGASSAEQDSAMLQLSQAMAAGRLQGDEFRSIMENAPMLADTIAKYTGKSKGELKEMSAEGEITADIIKNAMFMASDDINAKFETLPRTFADIGNQLKNGLLRGFRPVIEKINTIINSPGFDKFINNIIGGINLVAAGILGVINLIQSGWCIIEPILITAGFALIPVLIAQLWAMVPPVVAQAIAWLSVFWPLLLIGAAIGLLIYAMIKFGDVTAEVFGYIGGVIGVLIALTYNTVAAVLNALRYLADFVANLFIDIINGIISKINLVIMGLNHLPGVDIGLIGEISHLESEKLEFMGIGDAWNAGKDIGKSIGGSLSGLSEKITSMIPGNGSNTSNLGSYMINGALPVTGVNGKNIKVDISDEDIKYIRDIAEREYINKFSTATLAPNVKIEFGDIHETADINVIKGQLEQIMKEEIAVAAEGAYNS